MRADADKTLGQVRAEAAREREELRTRAERAERQADAYRDELHELRAVGHDAPAGTGSTPAPAKTTRRAARTPAA